MFCGILFGQYATNWPDFDPNDNPYDDNDAILSFIKVDGSFITTEDNWAALEIGAFVDGVCRGHSFMIDETSLGDPYPSVNISVFFDIANDTITFKLYDHLKEIEYDSYSSNIVLLTGESHFELYDDPETAVVLSFSTTFTKEITAYTPDTKNHYYLIASPIGTVSPADVTNMLSNNYDLYYFDQASQDGKEWITYKEGEGATNAGFSLQPGKGYLYANSGNGTDPTVTLTFTGAPFNNEDYEVNLALADGVDLPGWNLVGNPFGQTAYIQNSKPFYVMNTEGTEIVGATSNAINVMEGVFVEAESDGEEMTFTTTQPTINNEQIVLNLTRNNRGAAIDRAIVRFNHENGLPKFQLNPNNTKVYIPQNDKDYAVVHADSQGELPVNFKASKNGTYTFSVTTEEVDVNYLHLIDNLTGADIDLMATPSYSFEARTTDYASRFKLVFTVDRTTDEVFAFFSNGNWVINNDGKAVLQVIDINGRILSNEQISGNVNKHIDAAPGVYVMRLINGDNVKTQKIVVSK